MTTEKHGVEITLKSNIERAMKGAAAAAKGVSSAVKATGQASSEGFQIAGAAVVVFNQGLELAKKGLEIFRATIGASITTAMDFRKQGDDLTKFFKDLDKETKLVSARMGDILMPVFRGFIEAAKEATGRIDELVWAQKDVISTKLIEWIGGVAKALVGGLATAVQLLAKIWLGWQSIIQGVKIVVNEFFVLLLKGLATAIEGYSKLFALVGMDGISGALKDASEFVSAFGDEFDRSSDDAQDALAKTAAQIVTMDKTIATVEGTIKRVIDNGMVKAQEHARNATKGTTQSIEEQTQAIDKQKEKLAEQFEMIDNLAAKRVSAIEQDMARMEADARSLDAKLQAEAAAKEPGAGAQAGSIAVGAIGGPVGSIAAGAAEGGFSGALLAAFDELLNGSEALAKVFELSNDTFGEVLDALEPLFEVLVPLIPLITDVLVPVIEAFAQGIKTLSVTLLDIIIGIAEAWNGMIQAIANILKKLGGISIFGKKPLGFLEEWGENLEDKAKVSTKKMEAARKAIDEGLEETAEGVKAGAGVLKQTTDEMKRAMVGVPGIVKVSLHEFRAARQQLSPQEKESFSRTRFQDNGKGTQTQSGIKAEVVNVYGVQDPKALVDEVSNETRRQGVVSGGIMAAAAGPALPSIGPMLPSIMSA